VGEPVVLVMGVSGSGKTTVGETLAERTGWPFVDADLLHPQANIDKMEAGIPLTDADRLPWLHLVANWIRQRREAGEPGVVACSALRRAYRDILREADPALRIVYLQASRDVLVQRLRERKGHFFPRVLLDSQLATLEEPGPDENAISVSIGQSLATTVDSVLAALGYAGPRG
jgi:carbohydrate kinase (thermoresistant glucokinase family)